VPVLIGRIVLDVLTQRILIFTMADPSCLYHNAFQQQPSKLFSCFYHCHAWLYR